MSIKNLYEITSLVTKRSLGSQAFSIDNEDVDTNGLKYKRLIEGLTKELWKNDEEARIDLYGDNAGTKTFEMLKSRAKDRLVSMIFQSDTNKLFDNAIDKAFFTACKSYLSGVLLFNKVKFSSGIEQLKLALKIAREYQFFDLEMLTLRQLRKFASFSGNERNYEKYSAEIRKVQLMINAELESEELVLELQTSLVNSVDLSSKWINILEKNFARINNLVKEFESNIITIHFFRLCIQYYQVKEDYSKAIEVAEEYQRYLKSNPKFFQTVRYANASLNKLYCALFLKDYNRGTMFAAECEELYDSGSINWLIFKEYHFLLCMHTSQFGKAAAIFDQVLRHPSFDSYPAPNVEKWRIFEAYLEYADPIANNGRRRFNISKFLNEVPVFTKDKSGYNLTIIIAQVLLAVKTKELHRVVDREESLKTYLSRYVKKDKHARSYYFVKMLQVMIRYEFDPFKTSQISEKFFSKMKQSGPASPETSEVIPYEWLWSDLLARLREIKLNSEN